jgi:glycosyltransferase involved in cell wall biosynthesis
VTESQPLVPATVTVIVPTRNRVELLRQTLDAVLGQVGVALEVVVVDEGSTDETPAMLAALDDPRVRSIRHDEPKGVSAARNAGLALATAPWVAWCDDDDLWAPHKLSSQLAAAAEAPGAQWVVVGDVTVDEQLHPVDVDLPLPAERLHELLRHNVVPGGGSGVLARRELVVSVGGFDPALSITADWELWIRLWAAGSPASVARPLLAYRRHVGGMSGRNVGFRRELRHVLAKHAALREAHSVELDAAELQEWRGNMHLLGGRRVRASGRMLAAATSGRRVRYHLASAWRSLTAPDRLLEQLAAGGRAHVEPWAEEIEGWLKPLAGSVSPAAA